LNTKKDIFTHEIDDLGRDFGEQDALCRVNERVDTAIDNINATRQLAAGYTGKNPEMLAGFVLATTIDYNSHLLIKTIQDGVKALITDFRERFCR
jgi:hypothetical protein